MTPKTVIKTTKVTKPSPKSRYFEGIGRRKTAVARVRILSGKGQVSVNGQDLKKYFKISRLEKSAIAPLINLKLSDQFDLTAKVRGGGLKAQAEAVRLGLARALVLSSDEFKKRLRNLGFLTRDSRMVERKKPGLKKARRAPQWKKR